MSEKSANPAPLGLLGFGITTILLSFVHNFLFSSLDGMLLGMGIFYGGIAQVIAGLLEYRKGNTFGTVAFTSYGLFWLSYVALNWLGTASIAQNGIWPFSAYGPAVLNYNTPWLISQESLMAYFFMWGLFTFVMFFGTLKTNRALQVVFMSLAVLFFLLAARAALFAYTSLTSDDLELFTRVIGLEGIVTGASAVYLALAEVLNEVHGKTVIPIGQLV